MRTSSNLSERLPSQPSSQPSQPSSQPSQPSLPPQTLQTGAGAHGIVIEPSSRHAYITNMYADDVAVLDLKSLEVVARIPVGSKPNGVSYSPVAVGARPDTKIEPRLQDMGTSEMTH